MAERMALPAAWLKKRERMSKSSLPISAKRSPVFAEKHTQDLGYRPDELSVGQAQQQVFAEVLP